jgi:LPXTG-motif cell wall-anchored protein
MGASPTDNLASIVFAQEPFIGSTLFFVLGAVVILGLGGLLYYLRSKQQDDS